MREMIGPRLKLSRCPSVQLALDQHRKDTQYVLISKANRYFGTLLGQAMGQANYCSDST